MGKQPAQTHSPVANALHLRKRQGLIVAKRSPANLTIVEVLSRMGRQHASRPLLDVPVYHPRRRPASLAAPHNLVKAMVAMEKSQTIRQHVRMPSRDAYAHRVLRHLGSVPFSTAAPLIVKEPLPKPANQEHVKLRCTRAASVYRTQTRRVIAVRPGPATLRAAEALLSAPEARSENVKHLQTSRAALAR
jgi:hypothetical protein